MAAGLPPRLEIPESEKSKVAQQIVSSRVLIDYLNSLPEKPPLPSNPEQVPILVGESELFSGYACLYSFALGMFMLAICVVLIAKMAGL